MLRLVKSAAVLGAMTAFLSIGAIAAGTASAAPLSLPTCKPAWSAIPAYNGGSEVQYNAHNWHANWWNQADPPGAAGDGTWSDLGPCSH